MRAVMQSVTSASVTVEGKTTGEIGKGLLVLLGIASDDTDADLQYIIKKILGLRVFDDAVGIPNLSVVQAGGSVLLVSQFTLYGDAKKGNRPSYIRAANGEIAKPLYLQCLRQLGETVPVEQGSFGAMMQVALVNDGPFTILIDSRKEF